MKKLSSILIMILTNSILCKLFLNEMNNNDDEDFIHVHVIPHSHDDAGWLNTVQEYYDNKVKNILDNMMISLGF